MTAWRPQPSRRFEVTAVIERAARARSDRPPASDIETCNIATTPASSAASNSTAQLPGSEPATCIAAGRLTSATTTGAAVEKPAAPDAS